MKNKSWIYFGIFIDENSKQINLDTLEQNEVQIPEGWKMFNHHMTIAFNDGTAEAETLYNIYSRIFGNITNITVDGIGVSNDAIALRVKYNNPIANKTPHITIATPPNGKPVNSNKITEWYDIEPYEIKGKLSYYGK